MHVNYVSAGSIPEPLLKYSSHFSNSANQWSENSSLETQSAKESKTKRHALVVDDVSDITDMLAVLLSLAGYEVVTASSASAALAAAHEHHFDVIISDIGMPEMNGYELAKAVRALPGYQGVPMVAVTGFSMFDD